LETGSQGKVKAPKEKSFDSTPVDSEKRQKSHQMPIDNSSQLQQKKIVKKNGNSGQNSGAGSTNLNGHHGLGLFMDDVVKRAKQVGSGSCIVVGFDVMNVGRTFCHSAELLGRICVPGRPYPTPALMRSCAKSQSFVLSLAGAHFAATPKTRSNNIETQLFRQTMRANTIESKVALIRHFTSGHLLNHFAEWRKYFAAFKVGQLLQRVLISAANSAGIIPPIAVQ
jgi:hypothetical protein